MNPCSPLTYYCRHKRRAVLLLSIICAGTIGLYLLGALSLAIFYTPDHAGSMFLSNFAAVVPIEGSELDPAVVAQIRANPDVARIIPVKSGIEIEVPDPVRGDTGYYLLGLQEDDIDHVLQETGLTLGEGRYPQSRASEIMLSEKLAAALDLHVGDTVDSSADPDVYEDILEPMEVVGIMAGDVRLMIVPYDYLSNHELYRGSVVSALLVEAQEGRQGAVDDFLIDEIQSRQVAVQTLPQLRESIAEDNWEFYAYGAPLSIMLTLVTAAIAGVINQIALAKRLPEFGILHATGHGKKWLTRRLTLETSILAVAGWALGIALSWLILYLFEAVYFEPHGHDLNPLSFPPLVPVIPIPLAVIGFTVASARRVFARLDAVAIIERRELSLEGSQQASATPAKETKTTSSPKPLATSTFYRRHRHRAVVLISTMAAAIMMVSLLIFNFSITGDAQMTSLNTWKKMSLLVRSEAGPLDPGVLSQVRMHPSVERTIPAMWLRPLSMVIPPFSDGTVHAFGVPEEDMAYLIALFDLELKEGHLPRANTNEIVISEVTAQNRDLKIGDVIGSYDDPAYRDAPVLPVEMVISGVFARAATPEDECWLSFVSLEFLESHEAYSEFGRSLIVTPKDGQKATLDSWLEQEMANSKTTTLTYRQESARRQEDTRSTILTIAVIESAIALVIALSLAVLNYIFVSQRRSEFGVLNALGWHRLKLVWRAVRETAFTTTTAWGFSVALCCIVLLGLQIGVFTPLGLRFDFFNPTPWLSTLPIPIMVLVVTAGTIGRTLSKLDPVTIIEMR